MIIFSAIMPPALSQKTQIIPFRTSSGYAERGGKWNSREISLAYVLHVNFYSFLSVQISESRKRTFSPKSSQTQFEFDAWLRHLLKLKTRLFLCLACTLWHPRICVKQQKKNIAEFIQISWFSQTLLHLILHIKHILKHFVQTSRMKTKFHLNYILIRRKRLN